MRRILRHVVPVADVSTELELSGAIVHVDSRDPRVVEVWALDTGGPTIVRIFRVFGTGHLIPDGWEHVGSVIVAGGTLVWHLLELKS